MTSTTYDSVKGDIERLITPIARRNGCTNDDVLNVMSAIVTAWNKDKTTHISSTGEL